MSELHDIKVGELGPSQLLYTYGVGAIVDLPHLSVIVTGLDDWTSDPTYVHEIQEDRLLNALQKELGGQVRRIQSLPVADDRGFTTNPFDKENRIGVPVATFPNWMYCPACRKMAHLSTGLFELKVDYFHPERTHYEHVNCNAVKPNARKPTVLPARFMVTCENGHLDDFPWIEYTHYFDLSKCSQPSIILEEYGPSGEARDLYVKCETCGRKRQLAAAFGKDNRSNMPICTARRPHLHDYDPDGCELHMRAILLGASNLWFSHVLSTISIPSEVDKLDMLVAENWSVLEKVGSAGELDVLQKYHLLKAFAQFSLLDLWNAIEKKKSGSTSAKSSSESNILLPEWQAFSNADSQPSTKDFRLRSVPAPRKFHNLIEKVVLCDRLREVRALAGFTRIDSPGEIAETEEEMIDAIVPISRKQPTWVPGIEVRGEGIFIQFREQAILAWLARKEVKEWESIFFQAHREFRQSHKIENPSAHYPGIRYVLLHSFSHALMRQFALECGYTQASLRERIYSNNPDQSGGPMAGVLIYTSAPDSEGTLGGLVSLGQPHALERHLATALESARLCASDPTCAEHRPGYGVASVHAAACHACLFSPETSCEKGNKYLDRSLLAGTVIGESLAFFAHA